VVDVATIAGVSGNVEHTYVRVRVRGMESRFRRVVADSFRQGVALKMDDADTRQDGPSTRAVAGPLSRKGNLDRVATGDCLTGRGPNATAALGATAEPSSTPNDTGGVDVTSERRTIRILGGSPPPVDVDRVRVMLAS
jgi:hypothetical protein